ncbi:acylphosphatase-2 [Planococcus citri]|uniref:acylphosphatase-2 n=1 Tax=Planococcus citri TaxID=170843 RepID=UPI0031F93682
MIPENSRETIISVEFEVFGKVQGVYFTKYCRDRCVELSVVGWIKNSKKGTIVGKMQGTKSGVDKMITWLAKEGSPGCRIEKCELSNFEYLVKKEFKDFSIRF